MNEPSTPLMRQYAAIKKEHPTALLFFRLGDFYELFFDDAVLASRELQITLTSRNKEKGIAVPMCGVPYHAAEGYISKLIRKGFKVAICEQMENPQVAKKLVRREVTRVVTPGTAADSSLSSEENNFLAALAQIGDRVGFAALDLSTGEFRATEFHGENANRRIQEEIQQLRPKELLYASSAPLFERASISHKPSTTGTGWLRRDSARRLDLLPRSRHPAARKPFRRAVFGRIWPGWKTRRRIRCRSDSLLRPLHSARHAGPRGSHRLLRAAKLPGARRGLGPQSGIDRTALRGHRFRSHAVSLHGCDRHAHGQAPAALVDAAAFDRSNGNQCASGRGRSLRQKTVAREELRRALEGILDLERLLSRVTLETANPRDMLALASSLAKIPAARAALAQFETQRTASSARQHR